MLLRQVDGALNFERQFYLCSVIHKVLERLLDPKVTRLVHTCLVGRFYVKNRIIAIYLLHYFLRFQAQKLVQ